MANSIFYGLRPLSPNAQVNSYPASATIAKGDLLAYVSGEVLPYVEVTHTQAIGVAASAATSTTDCLVYDGEGEEFQGCTSGAYTAATRNGDLVDYEGATGAGLVNEDAVTNGTLLIVRAFPTTGAPTVDGDTNGSVVVTIAQHMRNVIGNISAATVTATGAGTFGSAVIGGGFGSTGCTIAATGNIDTNGAVGIDGAFRVGAAGASLFDVAAATGNTQIDGTLEVDGATGVDGAFRVGTAGASNFTASAAGAVTAASTMAITGATTLTGGMRLGAGAAPAETLAGDKVLVATDRQFIRFSNGGAARNCDLPTHTGNTGLFFFICNATGGANIITVRLTGAGATVVALDQGEGAFVFCDGATWGHAGIFTSMAVS